MYFHGDANHYQHNQQDMLSNLFPGLPLDQPGVLVQPDCNELQWGAWAAQSGEINRYLRILCIFLDFVCLGGSERMEFHSLLEVNSKCMVPRYLSTDMRCWRTQICVGFGFIGSQHPQCVPDWPWEPRYNPFENDICFKKKPLVDSHGAHDRRGKVRFKFHGWLASWHRPKKTSEMGLPWFAQNGGTTKSSGLSSWLIMVYGYFPINAISHWGSTVECTGPGDLDFYPFLDQPI